ncbi:ATP-dependent DNA helicase Q-like 3 isoform X2 [Brachypodium distachyon]|uniref:ATP-dependent DNA helicase n=1 Tax=Brachypodium distachyon TaxID=15368 RepID=A0A0Q3JT52_BRADI|nr:ATP-dependent DNA helicase Q-like 3 isoform X2 [Brachypodium distachyon]KQK01617.1 hypothetical protein BRADI_3g57087v3 [Brachypodium distachyon]|eukprot:XP_014756573.1 ATP-dependent DNA helicase Q-like 3 isoform X2 [Brachypodium distachyon]
MKKALPIKGALAGSRHGTISPKELENVLKQYFGYSGFRGRQLEAIEAVLSGRDCFCLMPTGGGKSMCYQIPALVKAGIVLVISPLIALMENQVTSLKSKGVPAEFLSSTQTAKNKNEAHCISTWGHDFRPSYRKISSLRKQFPDIPILALTATAVPKVQKDVISSLCLQNPVILRASFNRPNIFYEVRYKDLLDDVYSDISNLLKSSGNVCSIIYCLERAACDDLNMHLSQQGISSAVYHAGLNSKVRSAVLDDWLSSRTQVVVATVAFGMGIDRQDVRIVCHFNLPKSMESFYQESGRAGRDQQPSRSVLYYGLDDRRRMEFILRNTNSKKSQPSSSSSELSEKALADFSQIVDYCESSSCRRKKIIESFGEKVQPTLCQRSCDACKHPNQVSSRLEELRRVPNCRYNKISPVFKSSSVNPENLDTEFWNREDDASISAEDISDSDDEEAAAASNMAISKYTSKGGLEAKLDALERAENSYYQAKGQTKQQGGNLVDKKSISQTLRDACRKRLLGALGQARLRLGNLTFDAESSAAHLETESFKKYEKVGKTFYNSQIAATVRWLSSSNSDQIHNRLCALTDQITDNGAATNSDQIHNCLCDLTDQITDHGAATTVSDALGRNPGDASGDCEFAKTEPSDEFAKTAASTENMEHSRMPSVIREENRRDCAIGTMELPKIPSFGEFITQKGKDRASSSSRTESQLRGVSRKANPVISKEGTTGPSKKMKS